MQTFQRRLFRQSVLQLPMGGRCSTTRRQRGRGGSRSGTGRVEEALRQADASMYAVKRQRQRRKGDGPIPSATH